MIEIVDYPGVLGTKLMRHYFEQGIRQTAKLAANVPLDRASQNGELGEYTNPETQSMWVGFALGMRCSQRIDAALQAQAERV